MEGKQNNLPNGNAKEKIDQVEHMMINTISETMDLYGVTPSVGRLYATMYFKHEPITLDEMKDALGMSKPSMSTSVRKLQEINIVQKVWQKGSRKDSFIAEKNFFNYFTQFYGMKWEREVSMYLASLKKAQALLKEVIEDSETDEASREKAELDYQQLADAMVYYRWLDKLTKLTKSGEIFDYIPVDDVDEV
ncbi:GbsR/MarR family transcriptional regulator [Virgibacillus halodenitrificans]|uniref:HTH-type transcriptional regulator n=1 Tax=Virgibacillus halodenitrificans TaxID=1482 RepID=A0AAC9J3R9_VIRHA|nr:GbsR/MarR family transcriptional regulator [Virgibacillus halodenitrificans]APC50073.1 GbsR/MarR family transcriptional regulator [Virgibacillus halodenitrificans]MCG1027632.1 GbsR/MarR family transcriptional regulator [Virgibacillus halodenitrificans]WHX25660.1 GbsR/MarR family transcriptional regulator [Virgibacillus halodenitrificans]